MAEEIAEKGDAPIYSERYVAFVDILGFSNIVRASVSSPDQAEELAKILQRLANRTTSTGISDADDFLGQSFSDCIVLSENATPKGLLYLLQTLTFVSLDLLSNGILVRGGIAKGQLHHTDKVVFGPALIEAYRLESQIAKFPRIILDRYARADFKQNKIGDGVDPLIRPEIQLDNDGPPFLDIFSPFRAPSLGSHERLQMIADSCRAYIQDQLNSSIYDPGVFEKLRWLTIYWNSTGAGLQPVVFPRS
jgi:hypothetical protein